MPGCQWREALRVCRGQDGAAAMVNNSSAACAAAARRRGGLGSLSITHPPRVAGLNRRVDGVKELGGCMHCLGEGEGEGEVRVRSGLRRWGELG